MCLHAGMEMTQVFALLLIYNFHKTCFDAICFRHTHLEEEGFGREEKRVFLLQAVQAPELIWMSSEIKVTGKNFSNLKFCTS